LTSLGARNPETNHFDFEHLLEATGKIVISEMEKSLLKTKVIFSQNFPKTIFSEKFQRHKTQP